MNERDDYSQLSNKKLDIFIGRLKGIKGTLNYDNQVLGLIVDNGEIEGIAYYSNYINIALGARMLTLTEISLFCPNQIKKVLPFILYRTHMDLALKYMIMLFNCIIPEQETGLAKFYLQTMKQLRFEDFPYKLLSQRQPFNADMVEKL